MAPRCSALACRLRCRLRCRPSVRASPLAMKTMRGARPPARTAVHSSAAAGQCGEARQLLSFFAFTLLSVCWRACDICDGTRGQRSLADGSIDEVLELSAKGLEIVVMSTRRPRAAVRAEVAPRTSASGACSRRSGRRRRRRGARRCPRARASTSTSSRRWRRRCRCRARRCRRSACCAVPSATAPSGAAAAPATSSRTFARRPPRPRLCGPRRRRRRGRLRGALYDASARTAVAAASVDAFGGGRHLSRLHQIRNGAARRRRCTGGRARAGRRARRARHAGGRAAVAARRRARAVEAETAGARERRQWRHGAVMPVVGGALEPHALRRWVLGGAAHRAPADV